MSASLLKPLRQAFGLESVSDELIASCAARVALRCSRVDLTAYRRKPGQAALEHEARAAIVGAFRDHFPDRAHKFQESGHWPWAHAVIRGNRAWIEIDLGIDFSDPDEGNEVIELIVNRHPKQISIKEKIEDVLFHREPRKTGKEAPPLELVRKVALKEPAPIGKPISVDESKHSVGQNTQKPIDRKAVTRSTASTGSAAKPTPAPPRATPPARKRTLT